MRPHNIIDPFDPLTCADIQHTDQTIDVREELRRMGFCLKDGEWFTSKESRQTQHLCRRIITNFAADIGEVCRLELYPNRNDPQRGLVIAYQASPDAQTGVRVYNTFFSNDNTYTERHSNRLTEKLISVTHEEIQKFLSTNRPRG